MKWIESIRKAWGSAKKPWTNFWNKHESRNKFDELAEKTLIQQLIQSDFGVQPSKLLVTELKETMKQSGDQPDSKVETFLAPLLEKRLLTRCFDPTTTPSFSPTVVLFLGVNGSGKTTATAKFAAFLKKEGKQVSVVAADTFRAAAQEQLQLWCSRMEVPCFSAGKAQTSPSALVFDALKNSQKKGEDYLLIDTAGRLQQPALAEELKKIVRVIKKLDPSAPHEQWLVLDATLGQNMHSQLKWFHQAVGLTGLWVTKLDGTAKGGALFSLQSTQPIPLLYTSYGEDLETFSSFDPKAFTRAFLALSEDPSLLHDC